jgi:hypothetical protein
VVPVALTRPGDALCAALRRYKDAPAAGARAHHAAALAAMLRAFLERGHGRAALGWWDAVAVVPSSRRCASSVPHPLADVAARAGLVVPTSGVTLRPGAVASSHLQPRPEALVVAEELSGRRVLLLEDTWTTGAHALGAAGALEQAGASVVAVVVLGRLVDPSAAPGLARWWAAATAGASPPARTTPPSAC